MTDTVFDAVYYSTDELSIGQYTELLSLIQSDHAFASMRGGANVKYVDSNISMKTILDTRDASIFNFTMKLRGFGSIAFAKEAEHLGIPVTKGGVHERTGLSMYDTVRKFLSDRGVLKEKRLTPTHIGSLRGTSATFGHYCGRKIEPEHLKAFPSLAKFANQAQDRIEDIHMFDMEADNHTVTGHVLFDAGSQQAIVYNLDKEIVFRGELNRQYDLFDVFRMTGVRSSY
jgi:hypothetical protein